MSRVAVTGFVMLEFGVAVLAVAGAVASWNAGTRSAEYRASEDGGAFVGSIVSGPWVLLAALLTTIAGMLVVHGFLRARGTPPVDVPEGGMVEE